MSGLIGARKSASKKACVVRLRGSCVQRHLTVRAEQRTRDITDVIQPWTFRTSFYWLQECGVTMMPGGEGVPGVMNDAIARVTGPPDCGPPVVGVQSSA